MAKSKTSSSQNSTIILYKIDTGYDGNIMPINSFRILFPKKKEQLVSSEDKITVLKAYNKTMIQQLGICDVTMISK